MNEQFAEEKLNGKKERKENTFSNVTSNQGNTNYNNKGNITYYPSDCQQFLSVLEGAQSEISLSFAHGSVS